MNIFDLVEETARQSLQVRELERFLKNLDDIQNGELFDLSDQMEADRFNEVARHYSDNGYRFLFDNETNVGYFQQQKTKEIHRVRLDNFKGYTLRER